MQTVSDVMSRDVQVVSPRQSVRQAAQLMDALNVGALPVCEDGRLIGMVTDRDITVRATSAGLAPDEATVDAVMSTDVRWCHAEQGLEEVMRQMRETQIRRVPVLSREERRLVGIVSLGDIAVKAGEGRSRHELGRTVEGISYPAQPDREGQAAGTGEGASGAGMSGRGAATSLVGSDLLAEQMTPDVEVSATADPSDIVEVTPDDLVNRHAPGSTLPNRPVAGRGAPEEHAQVRHGTPGHHAAAPLADAGAPGIDAAGAAGASGGGAGTAGSTGTGVGSRP